MDRKFLEGLNLDKETVDTIMAEYGKSIQDFKDKVSDRDDIASQLDRTEKDKSALSNQLEELKGTAEERKSTIDNLNQELSDAKLTNLKTKIALDQGLPYRFADRLRGEDEESLTKDAEQMAGLVNQNKTSDPLRTTEPKNNGNDPYRSMLHSLNLGEGD